MSFLAPLRTSLRPSISTLSLRPTTYPALSSLHTSAPRQGLKESDHNREDLGTHYESHKHEQLKSSKEGKAKWKQELASNSEASVKADRGEVDHEDGHFGSLQEKTKGLPNEKTR
ncbi:hypothetical protein BO70DRAFT_393539 [Aspergillus heteromorphus CBS 117.55]|uniref:Mitochondrial carrier protein PET8 n=1 Tax=Aspergillus heteromorphus CBS 117.55 TaxID=1448321 RepID=A0A317WTA6_9EURO|nr:uncharacterized protein BO70DRAFT_393539 [Aspergillus heteromorphus CBS 117.55]PWY89021.1 hypothetical protein BO70DRAFT_393539 [Aspergillus heteromorphus CBS 117.55]